MSKAKPFKATPAPMVAGMSASDELARAALVRFVVKRLLPTVETTQNDISSKVSYAVRFGKLHRLASGRFRLSDMAEWAVKEWPGLFDDLLLARKDVESKSSAYAGGGAISRGVQLPSTLAACHDRISAMHANIVALEAQIAELLARLSEAQAEAEKLAPYKAKWDSWNANKGPTKRRR